ncbi:hypothetical protein [Marinitoga sp. 38H-ov]|uniref:hypothetical protein n=1 Tax=Marinitoga sp. 38H-ov TaxID=1755814 RepID=UPI0013EB665B|nr:hypothetical protein [Marinitoga sp. 38H-ov]KAF2956920.1 hypothetical protein AS160_02740 [Marinitoga sp. 38H-ov]
MASFFILLGLYIIYTYYSSFKRKREQKKLLKNSIVKIIKENDPDTAANIISKKIDFPVGTKIVINVVSEDTKVNLVFPLGILTLTKPLLYSLKPFLKKSIMSKLSKQEINDEVIDNLIESLDFLSEFYGDFVDVETDNGKTKVKIFVA